jgi:hypothetical protein
MSPFLGDLDSFHIFKILKLSLYDDIDKLGKSGNGL